jgi:2-oxoisovalerate dehydrogenase E1 component
MSNGAMTAPMVVRAGAGALRSSGPHHSGMYHPIFAHMPGLIVCVPSTPADAKGLMKSALRAGDPVIMLEPKALFASKGEVPVGEHYVPFGSARIARKGTRLTIVAAGQMVPCSLEAADLLAAHGIDVEIIDLRTIMPLDVGTIVESLKKTHHLLVVDEAWAMCGMGGEIAQAINELAFDELDAPVGRLHTLPTSHPFAPVLERAMLVDAVRIADGVHKVLAGTPPVPDHWHTTGIVAEAATAVAPVASAPAATNATQVMSASVTSGDEPIRMPFGDLTVSEGRLVKWLRAVGDTVKEGDVVAEIETDKAVVEIESPVAGVLSAIEQPVGAVVPMGGRIGTVRK